MANARLHATTAARPIDLLGREGLLPVTSIAAYRISERFARMVDAEGFVRVAGSRYSVPPAVVGQRVIVEQGEQRVVVRLGEVVIAEHPRAARSGECVTQPERVAAMWQLAFARTPVSRSTASALLIQQPVAVRPLAAYEEVTR